MLSSTVAADLRMLIIDPALEIERGAAVVAMVIAALWKYTDDQKAEPEKPG